MSIYDEIREEVERARVYHAPMNSAHEGYAVLLEEVDELWDEIKDRSSGRGSAMRAEAIQVAAMAVRLIEDVIDR